MFSRATFKSLAPVLVLILATAACSDATGSPSATPSGPTTGSSLIPQATTTTTSHAVTALDLDTAGGILLVRQRAAIEEQPTLFVAPDGTVVARSASSIGSFRWSGSTNYVLGYGTVGDETGPVLIDPTVPSVTPIPALAGREELRVGDIDDGAGESAITRLAVLSDDEQASYVIDLETGAVVELSEAIRRSGVRSFGDDQLTAYGPDMNLRLVDVTTGVVSTVAEQGTLSSVSPTGPSFIYRDLDLRAYRERTRTGVDKVITPSSALSALHRSDGAIVVVTAERIVVRETGGEETLYEFPGEFKPVLVRPEGVLVYGPADMPAVWVPTDGRPPVELDHPGAEARNLAFIDGRWLVTAENGFGIISLIDLQSGERSRAGPEAAERQLIGAPRAMGPWFWLPLRSSEIEDWLINRQTGQLVIVPTLYGLVPSPDGGWIGYGREAEGEPAVYLAPIEDPNGAIPVSDGVLIGWLPVPDED